MLEKRIRSMQNGVSVHFFVAIIFSLIYGACMPLVGSILAKFISDISDVSKGNHSNIMVSVTKLCWYLVAISFTILIS